jgi:transposase InsO family protein
MKSRFFWPNMYQDVCRYIRPCKTCQLFARRKIPVAGPQFPFSPPNTPFQKIAIDFIGPFPRSPSGKCYALTISDQLTRYVEAVPMARATALNTISALINTILYRHGSPSSILADQGSQFKSQEIKTFCSNSGSSLVFTPPYSQNLNGICEKNNDTIKRTTHPCKTAPHVWR